LLQRPGSGEVAPDAANPQQRFQLGSRQLGGTAGGQKAGLGRQPARGGPIDHLVTVEQQSIAVADGQQPFAAHPALDDALFNAE